MSKVLIVEDEEAIADIEKDYLELSGFTVTTCKDGTSGLAEALDGDYDIYILDVMLPGIDGFEICKKIREVKNTPIIMVSAKKEDIDKIRGLGVGADDYMTKPFSPSELVARVKAQLRRFNDFNERKPSSILEYMELSMNLETHRVFLNLKEVQLTPKEFAILELLWKNKGNVFSTEHIYDSLWSEEEAYDINNVVMVHIRNLRSKIEPDIKNPQYIKTVWGVGYKFS